MELFIGVVLGFFINSMFRAAMKLLPPTLPPPPQPRPRTRGQLANQAAYETQEAATPRLIRVGVQRRTQRGRRRGKVEREHNPFE
jgi:hypothetical protein